MAMLKHSELFLMKHYTYLYYRSEVVARHENKTNKYINIFLFKSTFFYSKRSRPHEWPKHVDVGGF